MEIDNRNIFFDNLKRGINLFTGAGFSKLFSPMFLFKSAIITTPPLAQFTLTWYTRTSFTTQVI